MAHCLYSSAVKIRVINFECVQIYVYLEAQKRMPKLSRLRLTLYHSLLWCYSTCWSKMLHVVINLKLWSQGAKVSVIDCVICWFLLFVTEFTRQKFRALVTFSKQSFHHLTLLFGIVFGNWPKREGERERERWKFCACVHPWFRWDDYAIDAQRQLPQCNTALQRFGIPIRCART